MQFAETVVKGPAGSLTNRWSSHRPWTIPKATNAPRSTPKAGLQAGFNVRGFRRLSGVNLVFEGALLRTAHGTGSESRRRSGYPLANLSVRAGSIWLVTTEELSRADVEAIERGVSKREVYGARLETIIEPRTYGLYPAHRQLHNSVLVCSAIKGFNTPQIALRKADNFGVSNPRPI